MRPVRVSCRVGLGSSCDEANAECSWGNTWERKRGRQFLGDSGRLSETQFSLPHPPQRRPKPRVALKGRHGPIQPQLWQRALRSGGSSWANSSKERASGSPGAESSAASKPC